MEKQGGCEGLNMETVQLARNNAFARMTHWIEVLIICVAYFAEFAKGARAVQYVILTCLIGIASPVIESITYKKNPSSKLIKHFVGYGFAIFYIFICITTNNKLAFIYVLPMLIVVTAYGDISYSIKLSVGIVIVNIAQVIFFISNGTYTKEDSAMIEIQVLAMTLICIYSLWTTRVIHKNNELQLQQIEEQSIKTNELLDTTLQTSNTMSDTIDIVSAQIEELNHTMLATKQAMNELNQGSTDTAEAVQNQLGMTEDIQNKITEVTTCADVITQGIADTGKAVSEGSQNIENLIAKVNESVEAGEDVKTKLQELCSNMEQMESVIAIINKITAQTKLLALNASIEAARAGEAGKGFAVVATEISGMAGETDQATTQIQQMLQEFGTTINNVVDVTNGMIELISSQDIATKNAVKSFMDIEDSTGHMKENSQLLEKNIKELLTANHEIVDSISTISSISEEVASHANNTLETTESNIDIMEQVISLTEQLKELAGKLRQ